MNTNDNFRNEYYNDNVSHETGSPSQTAVAEEPDYEPQYSTYTPKQKPRKKKRRFVRFLFKLALVMVVAFMIFMGYAWVKTLAIPQKTNVLIMATDEDGTRTDTLMLGTFDKKSKEISLISIPRDTYVTVSDEAYEIMRKDYPQPAGKSMKINAIHHFAGEKYGKELLIEQVSALLDCSIDYYVKVDFEAFRYIVDSVGGIEFDVPRNMTYSDPYQDLYIDLKKGVQILNGEQAEHVMRYRSGYATADLGRIEVQQDFVKAFISQTLSKGTILSNPTVYINAIFKYDFLETDLSASDIASYALLAGGIDTERVSAMTLPGEPAMRRGQSVYLPDMSEIANSVSKIIGD